MQHHFDNASSDFIWNFEEESCNNHHPTSSSSLLWVTFFTKVGRLFLSHPALLVLAPFTVGVVVGFSILHQQWFDKCIFYMLRWLIPLFPSSSNSNSKKKLQPQDSFIKPQNLCSSSSNGMSNNETEKQQEKQERMIVNRSEMLSNEKQLYRECSEIPLNKLPQHLAIIMDGNRRYSQMKYSNKTRGHFDGAKKLVEFITWCQAEQLKMLTVYAFSTENWNRDPVEVAGLMKLFANYCDEIRVEAVKRNIKVQVLSSETTQIPEYVRKGIYHLTEETQNCTSFRLNICLSYGARGEIVNACQSIAQKVVDQKLKIKNIDSLIFEQHLLTKGCPDPDVMLRTSGEMRLSNFMLWQLAYSEMYFVDKHWPELTKDDLCWLLRSYANSRRRRFGK